MSKILSIKDLSMLAILAEDDKFLHINPSFVEKVIDFNFSKKHDYIKIKFKASYGKEYDVIATFSDFKKWFSKNKKITQNVMFDFLKDFMKLSKKKEDIEEIIDLNGNIIDDNDMPTNATNSMVVSPKFDLEKIYRSSIPQRIRGFNGDYGRGFVVW